MITEELKKDIFSSLLEVFDDTDNNEKICNMFDKLSYPYKSIIKLSGFFLFMLTVLILILLSINTLICIKIFNSLTM